jgi:hypothetical protein
MRTTVPCLFNDVFSIQTIKDGITGRTQGVSKPALQWYSKCYGVTSVTKAFTLKRYSYKLPWTMDSQYALN